MAPQPRPALDCRRDKWYTGAEWTGRTNQSTHTRIVASCHDTLPTCLLYLYRLQYYHPHVKVRGRRYTSYTTGVSVKLRHALACSVPGSWPDLICISFSRGRMQSRKSGIGNRRWVHLDLLRDPRPSAQTGKWEDHPSAVKSTILRCFTPFALSPGQHRGETLNPPPVSRLSRS